MTTDPPLASSPRFSLDVLPWLVGFGALVIYLLTLNSWLTVNSLSLTAKVAGWDWRPFVAQPALFLATLPFRCLPPVWAPLALNAASALCAAWIVGLLARSVAILPHDRFAEQERLANNPRSLLLIRGSWLPPLLAAAACALQLTFWENAVSASAQILDLFFFAYTIRCLLEYRLETKPAWLDRAALVSGIALANDWAMLGFLPLLAIAGLVKLFQFFHMRRLESPGAVLGGLRRVMLRPGLFGLAGFSLFLLLPLVYALTPDSPLTFWQALRTQAASYKNGIAFVYDQFFRYHRDSALLLALVALLPVLLISIRWRGFSISDRTDFGLGTLILLISHAGFLIVCLWVAFDPFFSPRQIAHNLGFALPFLTFYYLAALSVGYYCGFFLLLFSRRPVGQDAAPTGREPLGLAPRGMAQRRHRILQQIVPKAVFLLGAIAVAGLFGKNLPVIQATNHPHLRQYGRLLTQSLPSDGGIVYSDAPLPLLVLQAALAGEGRPGRFVPVDGQLLASASYQKYLHHKFSERWPAAPPDGAPASTSTNVPDTFAAQIQRMTRLAQTNRFFYLHSACGKLFELFYLEPKGLVYELTGFPTNALGPPPLTPGALTDNEALWSRAIDPELAALEAQINAFQHPRAGLRKQLMTSAHLELTVPFQLEVLGRAYAAALNAWGVTLQRNGRAREATRCFEQARELNPRNVAATINLQCNTNLVADRKPTVAQPSGFEDLAGQYQNAAQLLLADGPVDEPRFCFQLGLLFSQNRLFRQASQQFKRVEALASGHAGAVPSPGTLTNGQDARAETLALLAEIRADPSLEPLARPAEKEISYLQTEIWFNALRAIHQQLRDNPDDIAALINEGVVFLRLGAFSNAIPPLTRVLELTNSPPALLNRAIASLCLSNLDVAQADYLKLNQAWPNDGRVQYGLGEIAYKRGDTNAAIAHYRNFLAKAEPASQEAKFVTARLNELQRGSTN